MTLEDKDRAMKLTGESLAKFVHKKIIFLTVTDAVSLLQKTFKTNDVIISNDNDEGYWTVKVKDVRVTIVAG